MEKLLTLIREGRIEDAESHVNQMQNQGASQASWHYARGRLCEAKGDIEEAIAAYEAAIEMDGTHLEAAFRLAFNLDLYGCEDRAVPIYESLAAHSPTHVNALINLAVIYEDKGNHIAAMRCIDRVLTDFPNHARARLFRKDIESSMNMQYDEFQERTRVKRDAIMDTPVADFELSVRSRNCLKKMNINSLGDLLRITEAELLAYKNFGETSLSEIKAMLKHKGLRLGLFKDETPVESHSPMPAMHGDVDSSSSILGRGLSEIELSGRSRKCLQRLNLMSVSDLVQKSEAELLSVKNFGQTSLNEIKQKLAEFNLSLRKPH
ncbi:MAG: tetratricopeptide repeat protein [Phycisphaerales bacterium]|nr:tetratricopeptide repeat protein [Phycisphaerales bacterium]